MHAGEAIPLVREDTLMKEALFVITAKGLGVTGVCDSSGALKGVITDGDLRRSLEKGYDILNQRASEIMKHRAVAHQAVGACRRSTADHGTAFHHLSVCF